MTSELRPYSAYKAAGVEWLGKVPEHWEVQRLKDAVSFTGGGTPSKANDSFWSGHIPWVSPKDMTRARLNDTADHISNDAVIESAASIVAPGAVLMVVRSGILRRKIPVAINMVPMALNQDMKALRPKNGIAEGEYLHMLIQGNESSLLREWTKQGATVESIEHDLLANSRVPIPPLSEQAAIVRYLDHVDRRIQRYIRAKQKLIALLQEERKKMTLESIKSASARSYRLETVAELVARPIDRANEQNYTPIGLYNRGRGIFRKLTRNGSELGDSDFFWIEEGDVIISGQFAWEGAIALAGAEEDGCVVSHRYPILCGKSQMLESGFLLAFLQTDWGQLLLDHHSRGAAGRNRPLNARTLMKEKISLPTLQSQRRVVKMLERENKLRRRIKELIEQLNEYRTRLIADVVMGKLDVREAAARLPEEIEGLQPHGEDEERSGRVDNGIERSEALH